MKARRLILPALLFAASLAAQTTESKLATIRGTVLDAATSAPIPKTIVKLAPVFSASDNPDDQSTTATTDDKGAYEFKSVKPGEYRISTTKTGYLASAFGKKPSSWGMPLGVGEGATLSGIDVKMERGGVISGRVLNEDGEPFPNVSISAMRYVRVSGRRRLLPSGNAQTDDRGEYRLHDLRPDTYYIRCNPQARYGPNPTATDGKHGYPSVLYPGVATADAATPIKIGSGSEEVANFSVSPASAYVVKGTLAGATGDANVMLQPADDPFFFAGPNAMVKNGEFELKGVLPGSYTVVAMSFTDGKQRITRQRITVADGDVSNVRLNFDTGSPEIHGTVQVLGDSKQDLSGMSVSLRPPFNSSDGDDGMVMFAGEFGAVNKDGTFTISPSNPGSRVMAAVGSRHFDSWYLKSVTFGTRDVTDTGFIPTSGASLQIVMSPNAASVEGQVLDKDGKPFSGAHVFTIPEESRRTRRDLFQSATSDQRGYFEIRALPPGSYKVIAVEDDETSPPFDAEFLKAHLSDAPDLKAEEKGKYNLKVNVIPAEAAK